MGISQILIRLRVDATAIKQSLSKVSLTVKAWGRELVHDLGKQASGVFKGMLGVEGVTRVFDFLKDELRQVSEKVLRVKQDSAATGLSTNFIQGLYEAAEKAGVPFEALQKNLIHFSRLIGDAKNGSAAAREKLIQYGVATNDADIKTLNLRTGLEKLRAAHVATADATKNSAREADLLGKGYASLLPILNMTREQMEEMDQANFFSKLTPQTIALFTGAFGAKAQASDIAKNTTGNLIEKFLPNVAGLVAGNNSGGGDIVAGLVRAGERMLEMKGAAQVAQENELAAQNESIAADEERLDQANKLLEVTEKQAEVQATIADRDKEGLKELAERARHLLGQKSPLERAHTVTARMRQALKIDNLEQQATLAWQRGNDSQSQKLQSEADRLRAGAPWLKRADQNPMQKVETELAEIKNQMVIVQDAAKLVVGGGK